MNSRFDLTGRQFERLTVIERAEARASWRCRCVCGASRVVRRDHLLAGHTKSCGCWKNEKSAAAKRTHGQSPYRTPTPEYRAWCHMKARCYAPRNNRFAEYGRRGIRVCTAWRKSFQAFFDHLGPRPSADHSLDRINVNGHYEPSNVRWATRLQQANNKRSNIAFRDLAGERVNLAALARHLAIPPQVLSYRLTRAGVL